MSTALKSGLTTRNKNLELKRTTKKTTKAKVEIFKVKKIFQKFRIKHNLRIRRKNAERQIKNQEKLPPKRKRLKRLQKITGNSSLRSGGSSSRPPLKKIRIFANF